MKKNNNNDYILSLITCRVFKLQWDVGECIASQSHNFSLRSIKKIVRNDKNSLVLSRSQLLYKHCADWDRCHSQKVDVIQRAQRLIVGRINICSKNKSHPVKAGI